MPKITVITEFEMKDEDCICIEDARQALDTAMQLLKREIPLGIPKASWEILENAQVPDEGWYSYK